MAHKYRRIPAPVAGTLQNARFNRLAREAKLTRLNPENWPFWLQVIRIGVTILVVLLCGAHAWSKWKDGDNSSPWRWVFFMYGLAFSFTAWANFVMVVVSINAGQYHSGPYHVGTFTLLLAVTYFLTVISRLWRRD